MLYTLHNREENVHDDVGFNISNHCLVVSHVSAELSMSKIAAFSNEL